ncbi:MAG: M15 family metallopeptidase [Actinomycetota bacterium]
MNRSTRSRTLRSAGLIVLFFAAAFAVSAVVLIVGVLASAAVGPHDASRGAAVQDESPQVDAPKERPGETGYSHDGAVVGDVSVFDDSHPGVTNLAPELLAAVRAAAHDAEAEGIELRMNSGWRSPEYQQQLLREAVSTYGSEEEAARWVATAEPSEHVSGDAIDIGDYDATAWLSVNGDAYGLCQIYENEPWHYELRPDAVTQGCPDMFIDPTEDPRMVR